MNEDLRKQDEAETTKVEPIRRPSPLPQAEPRQPDFKPRKSSTSNIVLILLVVILLAAATLIGVLIYQRFSSSNFIDKDRYQAVTITDGRVYFGKLKDDHGEYLKLTNVFYLQKSDAVADNDNKAEDPQQAPANDVQLIKLGTEIHGPTDEMHINRDQVLFVENLKDDGGITKSMTQYYETQP